MLFFYNSDDLHLRSQVAEEILALLTLRFFHFNRNFTLRIYSVSDKQLQVYHSTNSAQNKMAGVYDLPDDSTRLKDREMKGEDEYNEELRKKRDGKVDNDIFAEKLGMGDDDEEGKDVVGDLPGAPGAGGFKGKIKDQKSDVTSVSSFRWHYCVDG
jgi:hypothetical protein